MTIHKFQLVLAGDVILPGDQPLMDDCVTWGALAGWEVGMAYIPTIMVPLRRPIASGDNQ